MTSAPPQTEQKQAPPGPGAYPHTSSEEYHSWDSGILSKSLLWSMVTGVKDNGDLELCPAKLRYEFDHPRPTTDAMVEGDALDCLLLEPHEFEQRFIMSQSCQAAKKRGSEEICGSPGKVLVDGEWRCGTHGRGGEPPPPDKTLLTHIQMAQTRSRDRSIRTHPEVSELLEQPYEPQMAMVGRLYGFPAKGRADVTIRDAHGQVIDLKTAKNHKPHAFRKDAIKYGYHVQLFIYAIIAYQLGLIDRDGLLRLLVCGKSPIFGAGKDAVYPVMIYDVGDELLELGRKHTEQLVSTFARCDEQNDWPVQYEPRAVLTVPDWIETQDDEGSDSDDH